MRNVLRILLMLGLMVGLTLLAGCGSKKKLTELERTKTEKVVKENISVNEIKNVSDSTSLNIGNNKLSVSTLKKIEAIQADSSKTITITDSQGNVTTIKGANVIISDLNEVKHNNDTVAETNVKSDKNVLKVDVERDNSEKEKTNKRTSETHIKRTGFVFQITIGVLIVALLVLAYYKRSSIIGWFS